MRNAFSVVSPRKKRDRLSKTPSLKDPHLLETSLTDNSAFGLFLWK